MQELITSLGIEPRVMLINAVGFIILLALLKKFAFGPIGQVLADRERAVAASIDEAERTRQMALADKRAMDEQIAKLSEQGALIVAEAEKQAEQRRQEILRRAEEQSRQIVAEGEHKVERAAEEARALLRRETAEIAVGISERALRESLDEKRQAALVEAFIADIERVAKQHAAGGEDA